MSFKTPLRQKVYLPSKYFNHIYEFPVYFYHRFKNAIFEISPAETVGVFEVKAKFMGVHLETLQLEYQVLYLFYQLRRSEKEGG